MSMSSRSTEGAMTSVLPLLVMLLVDVSASEDTPLASPFLQRMGIAAPWRLVAALSMACRDCGAHASECSSLTHAKMFAQSGGLHYNYHEVRFDQRRTSAWLRPQRKGPSMPERRRAAVPGVRLDCTTRAHSVMLAADRVCTLIQQRVHLVCSARPE